MTSKQRAYLRGLANELTPIVMIGKGGASPEVVASVEDAYHTHELVKIGILKNCTENPDDIADVIAARTHSDVVQVIGKKIVLYRADPDDPKIVLPAAN